MCSYLWLINKYSDLVQLFNLPIDLEVNAGVPVNEFAQIVGWLPPPGAAAGIFADFWLEFGFGSFPAAFAVG